MKPGDRVFLPELRALGRLGSCVCPIAGPENVLYVVDLDNGERVAATPLEFYDPTNIAVLPRRRKPSVAVPDGIPPTAA
jgi:hypothetical protein